MTENKVEYQEQRVQLLASNAIDNVEKLSKLLDMQLNLIKKMNAMAEINSKRALTIKTLETAVRNMLAKKFVPQWRLTTTKIYGEFEFTISHFKEDSNNELKEYPLYNMKGPAQSIKTSMIGSGVDPVEVNYLLS